MQDQQLTAPAAHCVYCGGEIYPGETVRALPRTGGLLHEDCLAPAVFRRFPPEQSGGEELCEFCGETILSGAERGRRAL